MSWRDSRKLFLAALSLSALAASAWAQADPGIAYAVISDGNAASVTPSSSQNPGGGAVTSTRSATGTYAVTFAGTDASGWSVMAEASGSASNYCLAGANNSTPASEIDVGCFTSNGTPVNSPFVVSGFGPGNLKNIAYALVQSTGVLAASTYNFNPSGTIVPTRIAAGHFSVQFNGLNGAGGGDVQVSAGFYGNTSDATCYAGTWNGANAVVDVWCVSPAGAPADANFHVAFIPAGVSPAGAAFVWANNDTSASYTPSASFTSAPGSVLVTRTGPGVYSGRSGRRAPRARRFDPRHRLLAIEQRELLPHDRAGRAFHRRGRQSSGGRQLLPGLNGRARRFRIYSSGDYAAVDTDVQRRPPHGRGRLFLEHLHRRGRFPPLQLHCEGRRPPGRSDSLSVDSHDRHYPRDANSAGPVQL